MIGASAGGVPALRQVVGDLPDDFPACVLVVLHVNPDAPSLLPAILGRETRLETRHAVDGDRLDSPRILVAPPAFQTTVDDGRRLRVERGPRQNNMRPAIDPLMRSAARELGPDAVGVILTGMLHDGTAGLAAIKSAGGATVVQDPGTAEYPSMPRHAVEGVRPDHVVPLEAIPALLERLTATPLEEVESIVTARVPAHPPIEVGDDNTGQLTAFTCPECHGTLWELDEAGVPTFRCRVGHRYGIESLVASQSAGTEASLWAAARALEEKASLNRRVAVRLNRSGHGASALRFERIAEEAEVQAAQVKLLLEQVETPPAPSPASAA